MSMFPAESFNTECNLQPFHRGIQLLKWYVGVFSLGSKKNMMDNLYQAYHWFQVLAHFY